MKWTSAVVCFLAVLFPCLLLLPRKWGFYVDWANHLWLISYFGHYYRAHGTMPLVVNTPQMVGEVAPVFYGYVFYPVVGWLSSWMGPDGALRLAAFATLGLQFILVRRVLNSLGCPPRIALAAACLVTWAIYPLTNLYNRSALTEFFAAAWLTCALCCWFSFLRAVTTRSLATWALGLGLFSVLAAGTHPITAWMGCCLFAVLGLGAVLALRGDQVRRRLVILGLTALVVVLCLSPWLYATVLFQRHLAMSMGEGQISAIAGIDQWGIRFFPLPLDLRCLSQNHIEVSTPYLDAQANVPLLLLTVVCLAKLLASAPRRGNVLNVGVLILIVAYVGFCIVLSLHAGVQNRYLPKPFRMVQFTYRWVNQINLALLALLCMALLIRGRGGLSGSPIRLGGVLLGCLLVWSGAGVLVKLEHAYFIHDTFYTKLNYRPDAQLPQTFYGLSGYSTPCYFPVLQGSDHVEFGVLKVDPAVAYGTAQPLRVVAGQASMLVVSAQAFPWNRLYVDGRQVPAQDIRASGQTESTGGPRAFIRQAIPLSVGEHVVEYRFEPDRMWSGLAWLSQLTMALLFLSCAVAWGAWLISGPATRTHLSTCRFLGWEKRPRAPVGGGRALAQAGSAGSGPDCAG